MVVAAYDVASANDCPDRDPCDWVLEGIAVEAIGGDKVSSERKCSQLQPSRDGTRIQITIISTITDDLCIQASVDAPSSSAGGSKDDWTELDRQIGVEFGSR